MKECGGRGGEDGNGAAKSGDKCLQELNLGMDGKFLFEIVAAEVRWISGGISTVYRQLKESHLGERGVDGTNALFFSLLFSSCFVFIDYRTAVCSNIFDTRWERASDAKP